MLLNGLDNGMCDYIVEHTQRCRILWRRFLSNKIVSYVIVTVGFRGFRVLAIYVHFGIGLKKVNKKQERINLAVDEISVKWLQDVTIESIVQCIVVQCTLRLCNQRNIQLGAIEPWVPTKSYRSRSISQKMTKGDWRKGGLRLSKKMTSEYIAGAVIRLGRVS